ncbi:DNA primase [Bacteroidia bacterium]|nr:DNA primase [Bacteroidia bacterium]
MTLNEIKQISIREYLGQMNMYPIKEYGYYGMYHCPFRSDHNASFKVDYNKNVWHDFGANEGGSIIDLVMRMKSISFVEAVRQLESKCVNTQKDNWANSQPEKQPTNPTLLIQDIIPITHPKLIAWVQERKIDLDLANLYCQEIYYLNQGKNYFSIGFRNDKEGYELNSPPDFKGCISPKDITTIRDNRDACLVFEGFWDFLSYLTIQKIKKTQHDVVILNSVANIQKAMDFIQAHRGIYTYLDNDDAGRKATELIQSAHSTVYNRSTKYADYKDLNDYLRQKPIVKSEAKKKKIGLKR